MADANSNTQPEPAPEDVEKKKASDDAKDKANSAFKSKSCRLISSAT